MHVYACVKAYLLTIPKCPQTWGTHTPTLSVELWIGYRRVPPQLEVQGGGRRCDGGTFELQPLVMDVGSRVQP